MKISIVVVKTLFLAALFILSNYNLHLYDDSERNAFFGLYYDWMESLFNHGLELTGYFVKFEWLPEMDDNFDMDQIGIEKTNVGKG